MIINHDHLPFDTPFTLFFFFILFLLFLHYTLNPNFEQKQRKFTISNQHHNNPESFFLFLSKIVELFFYVAWKTNSKLHNFFFLFFEDYQQIFFFKENWEKELNSMTSEIRANVPSREPKRRLKHSKLGLVKKKTEALPMNVYKMLSLEQSLSFTSKELLLASGRESLDTDRPLSMLIRRMMPFSSFFLEHLLSKWLKTVSLSPPRQLNVEWTNQQLTKAPESWEVLEVSCDMRNRMLDEIVSEIVMTTQCAFAKRVEISQSSVHWKDSGGRRRKTVFLSYHRFSFT